MPEPIEFSHGEFTIDFTDSPCPDRETIWVTDNYYILVINALKDGAYRTVSLTPVVRDNKIQYIKHVIRLKETGIIVTRNIKAD